MSQFCSIFHKCTCKCVPALPQKNAGGRRTPAPRTLGQDPKLPGGPSAIAATGRRGWARPGRIFLDGTMRTGTGCRDFCCAGRTWLPAKIATVTSAAVRLPPGTAWAYTPSVIAMLACRSCREKVTMLISASIARVAKDMSQIVRYFRDHVISRPAGTAPTGLRRGPTSRR